MLSAQSEAFLESLLKSSGPSGFEIEPAAVFRKYVKQFADKVHTDVTGNTIACLNPDAKFKVMLAGHYDEIGFQVVYISDEGLIYFREVGGIDKLTAPGLEVDIINDNSGKIRGVIGRKPIHLQTPKEREVVPELKEMWIDIGAENGKEASKLVSVGDPIAMRVNYLKFGKHRVMSKGLDDKIGAFVIAEAFRELSKVKGLKVGVYCVGTVQEELGLRGAHTSAFGVDPNVGICVDVGFATDVPGVTKQNWGDAKLGEGAMIQRNADSNPVLLKRMVALAKKSKIKHQLESGHRASGGTDTAQMQLTRSGVATALISIPNRYMHTPVEICDLRDVEAAVKLIVGTIASFNGKETFIPGMD